MIGGAVRSRLLACTHGALPPGRRHSVRRLQGARAVPSVACLSPRPQSMLEKTFWKLPPQIPVASMQGLHAIIEPARCQSCGLGLVPVDEETVRAMSGTGDRLVTPLYLGGGVSGPARFSAPMLALLGSEAEDMARGGRRACLATEAPVNREVLSPSFTCPLQARPSP
mmetsp:Transcript_27401/g.81657  ORF Transcript_27401/g.81657 Transcript_27401/m.81657 type:complete len:168 (-) Transcript_27401:47-550(-)